MKISKRVNDTVTVHAEADKMTDLFEELAQLEEVFSIAECTKCNSKMGVKHVCREVEDNKFYEVQCKNFNCRAKFSFGVHKKGNTLFPHWKEKFRTMNEIMGEKDPPKKVSDV